MKYVTVLYGSCVLRDEQDNGSVRYIYMNSRAAVYCDMSRIMDLCEVYIPVL